MSGQPVATHSSLDLFQKYSVLGNFKSGNIQTYCPVSAVNGPTLEFSFETARTIHTDLQNIDLHIGVRILKADGTKLAETDNVCFVNNTLHSLFTDYELYLNNERVDSAHGQYGHHPAALQTECRATVFLLPVP